ncbi:MAG TPA: porin family protein [Candidatus Aminicenantes bacterium]|nr:porin family protein [Candidatus Aminicenantes bacterium]
MKKTIVTALAAFSVLAFGHRDLGAEVGLRAGVSLAKYQWAPESDDLRWRFLPFATGGLVLEAGRGVLSVQPGLFFTRMGGRYAVDGDSLEFRFDYVQLPLLFKMNNLTGGTVCPFFGFGGYGAYLVKAQGVLVLGGDREVEDLIEEYERFDAGLLFSAGFDFRLARTTFTLECRYAHGLLNALKFPDKGEFMKHRSIMALAGVGF